MQDTIGASLHQNTHAGAHYTSLHHSTPVQWCISVLVQYCIGIGASMHWCIGIMVQCIGVLVYWCIRVQWCTMGWIGVVVEWWSSVLVYNVALVHLCKSTMVHNGVYWCIGVLVHWCTIGWIGVRHRRLFIALAKVEGQAQVPRSPSSSSSLSSSSFTVIDDDDDDDDGGTGPCAYLSITIITVIVIIF